MSGEAKVTPKIIWNSYADHGPTWCVECGCVMGNAPGAFKAHEQFHERIAALEASR